MFQSSEWGVICRIFPEGRVLIAKFFEPNTKNNASLERFSKILSHMRITFVFKRFKNLSFPSGGLESIFNPLHSYFWAKMVRNFVDKALKWNKIKNIGNVVVLAPSAAKKVLIL